MKQMLLLLNPIAGTRKACRYLPEIISIFNRANYDVSVYITNEQGDATEAVKKLGAGQDLIVCSGGDGTLNETVNGLLKTGLDIPIGYIPAGSTNDFADSLSLSTQVMDAAMQIVKGTPHYYDVGRVNDRYFVYVASFGVFTKTSYKTPQYLKNALGHLAYVLQGIQELTALHPEHILIQMEGQDLEGDYLFGAVCNSTSLGGILTLDSKVVDLSDGLLELLLIPAPKNLQELSDCIVALQKQDYTSHAIYFTSTSRLKITSSTKMQWALDGEKKDGAAEIQIENVPRAFCLIH